MTKVNLILEPGINGKYVYYSGHTLEGTVELSLTHVHKFRGLYVEIFGQARAHWSESRGKSTVHYEGIEVYINSRTYLFGQHGGPSLEIEPGIHRYNFVCKLPQGIPYSVHFNKGTIAYHVQVVLDIPWHFDKEIKLPITIIRNDDLNLYPGLCAPLSITRNSTFLSFFSESKPLFMTINLPHTGFVRDQIAPIRIIYDNKSNVDVIRSVIILKQIITFTCHTPNEDTKVKEYKIRESHAPGVNAQEAKDFSVQFPIPSTVINSNESFCKVISIAYVFEIIAKVSGLHSHLKHTIPISIGSIPVATNVESLGSHETPVLPQSPSDDLPPSYGEAIKLSSPLFPR